MHVVNRLVHRARRRAMVAVILASTAAAVLPGIALADCCRSGDGAGTAAGAAANGGGAASITAWVIRVDRDTVSAPPGMRISDCTRWRPAAVVSGPEAVWVDVATFRIDRDGVLAELHVRECGEPVVRQHTWIRDETPESLLEHAVGDLRRRLLLAPVPITAPPQRAIVHLPSWFSAADPGVLRVTATAGGVASTAEARVRATVWTTGDGATIRCAGVGVPWTPTAGDADPPCGHTYVRVDPSNRLAVRFEWAVHWSSSAGHGGALADVDGPTTHRAYPVEEIQSIGVRG